MRAAVTLLILAGCNQIFGLEPTQASPVVDAQYFDAPIDAPFTCPGPGSGPQFSRLLHQIPQYCMYYDNSDRAEIAVAYCSEPAQQISVGPIDGPLAPLAGLEQDLANGLHRDYVHLAPEGDELFFREWQQGSAVGRIRSMRRVGDTFQPSYDVTSTTGTWESFVKFGRPSAAPLRHMFILNPSGTMEETRLDAAGNVTPIHTYTPSELGIDSFYSVPTLTSDGLHIVVSAALTAHPAVVYSSRTSIDDLFGPSVEIVHLPLNTYDPFLSDDCSRIYFSAIQNVLWVQRI